MSAFLEINLGVFDFILIAGMIIVFDFLLKPRKKR